MRSSPAEDRDAERPRARHGEHTSEPAEREQHVADLSFGPRRALRPAAGRREPAHSGHDRHATWVRPELVCEVDYTEWTREGRLRHPSYKGLREDVDPRSVVRQ